MDSNWTIRTATAQDQRIVRRLLLDATFRHEHLDWIHALDLLDQGPFLLAESGDECVACLACPPDVPGSAWLRLLLVSRRTRPAQAWPALWPPAHRLLAESGVFEAAALPVSDWLVPLLEESGFRCADEVVFLVREGLPPAPSPGPAELRSLRLGDLPAVTVVDRLGFAPLWQLSERSLRQALEQSEVATVALVDGAVIGYQMCTGSSLGAHLARLAVHPRLQNRGLGRLLVTDALHQLHRRGFDRVTVNTQESNLPSLSLYARLGFRRTGQDYPVYTLKLNQG